MRIIAQVFASLLFCGIAVAVIFASAGRTDLPWVWGFFAVHAALMTAYAFVIPHDLIQERLKPPQEGRVHDHHRALVMPLIIGSWVLTGLDVGRLHWTDDVPVALRWAGLVVSVLGMLLTIWAVATNRFYSSVIRVQHDRGQQPVTAGPYGVVRHPGYTGTILTMLGSGPALGSWLGAVPLVLVVALFLRRTLNEDRLLRGELGGYAEYAGRVRRRLVPGVW